MYSQADRCERTAYVSGLQSSITDIELFEFFNKVAHVEKVILRSGSARHALVVFKSVEGLYKSLVEFNNSYLHGRQLHIRPLRESSHANNETINVVYEQASRQNRRTPTNDLCFPPPPSNHTSLSSLMQNRSYGSGTVRNSNNSYIRRRNSNNKNNFSNEPYRVSVNGNNIPQFTGFNADHIPLEDYSEGAHRFDSLANVVRSCQPLDPYLNRMKDQENKLSLTNEQVESRTSSARDSSTHKTVPPTWKMELKIKKNDYVDQNDLMSKGKIAYHPESAKLSPEDFMAKFTSPSHRNVGADRNSKKKRPQLSVINPSLFYEQYPRTSSPVTHQGVGSCSTTSFIGRSSHIQSPHDPAVVAYRAMRDPTNFDGLSPIDTKDCSFATKHFGNDSMALAVPHVRLEMTDEELSDMIVSTGNLRLDPLIASRLDEPAPWSPVKRVRAESGSLSMAQIASPQFSPIIMKTSDLNETEDNVFNSETSFKKNHVEINKSKRGSSLVPKNIDGSSVEQKLQNFEDVNNSRLPSNSHSANPCSENRKFDFPSPYHSCRHASVPSLTHLVGDMADFSANADFSAGMKFEIQDSSVFTDNQNSSAGKSWAFDLPNLMPEKQELGPLSLEKLVAGP